MARKRDGIWLEVGGRDRPITAYFYKNAREVVGVALARWRGEWRIDIRQYVALRRAVPLSPTKKGVSLPAGFVQELVDSLRMLGGPAHQDAIVTRIPKSLHEQVFVGATSYKNQSLIFIRTFVLRSGKEGEEWLPTTRGVSLRTELRTQVIDALEAVSVALGGSNQPEALSPKTRRFSRAQGPLGIVGRKRGSDIHLAKTPLSLRVRNALLRSGISTVTDLVRFSFDHELTEIRYVGPKGAAEIERFLKMPWDDPGSAIKLGPTLERLGGSSPRAYDPPHGSERAYIETLEIARATLSIRVRNALLRSGIETVGDLLENVRLNQLHGIRNLGAKSKEEIHTYLMSLGIAEDLQ